MAIDPAIRDHQAWLGYLQPDGLVVSPAALVDAQAVLDHNTIPLQQRFLPLVSEVEHEEDTSVLAIANLEDFLREFLQWPEECLYGADGPRPVPEELSVALPEFSETLKPTFAFRELRPKAPANPWLLLVQEWPLNTELDAPHALDETKWHASPSRRLERLLRETKVPIGLLSNGTQLRLMYAPLGETSGSITFPVRAMTEVAGRPILAALSMLLDCYRLLAAPSEARLPALLQRSRDYQSRVSAALAQQVLDSLYELLRGFQAANEYAKGDLLRDLAANEPDKIYDGLLTVLMRLVFLLFAEDRGVMPTSDLYVRNYSVHGLFQRLRVDHEQYPLTMDHRYGAWAQLLALFRLVYDGSRHPQMAIPARHGYLFDPDRFPFLEGRTCSEPRLPLMSDGVIHRVLSNLLLLEGERLSYRTLDVEEIGSVYQTIMGFKLEEAAGESIAIVGKRKHKGEVPAPTAINLEELLRTTGADRNKWLMRCTGHELAGEAERSLESATSIDALLAVLERKIARNATPGPVARGTLFFQPTEERRRSGSHYTPRSFTEPIVRTTLAPILKRLGEHPTPEQILDLKICDLAVGSGAFQVETCRQLADELVKAWHHHGGRPPLPPDETEELLARRLVAQRCLYGVDRNPMAVDLAKLSLWLTTLAKDHPFTFLDHSFRCGDSLVGLSIKQITRFHWDVSRPRDRVFDQEQVENAVARVMRDRREILQMAEDNVASALLKQQKLVSADEALKNVREAGDLIIAAFFNGSSARERDTLRQTYLAHYAAAQRGSISDLVREIEIRTALGSGPFPVTPFHWEAEFPEVFERDNPGFDGFVGNPPFAGKNTLAAGNAPHYSVWLQQCHRESHGNADVVAHFYRRAFDLLRQTGVFGLIATNTIGQGDTRSTGLRWICSHGGEICSVRKRVRWPGSAAVVVSIVHVTKGALDGQRLLDDREVETITAFLFHRGGHDDPVCLEPNAGKSFIGSYILGMGFTFDDTDTKGVATPLSEMRRLIEKGPRNAEVIFPYIGGEEINTSPTHDHHRYVINFGERSEEECRRRWPDLMAIVEAKVRPTRQSQGSIVNPSRWWMFARPASNLANASRGMERVLVISRVGQHCAFAFMPSGVVYAESTVVYPLPTYSAFCSLQSRPHEIWARFLASSMKDDLRYTPSDCFETFPFPEQWETNAALEEAGKAYYEFRAGLMVQNNEGLTKTYNRFHNPEERSPDILKLRELHAAMDRAVLDAYGWSDIPTDCEFILDYEIDEEEWGNRKKPWRYRWPDDIRDEVLARLLELNAQRAEEERRAAATAAIAQGAKAGRASGRRRKQRAAPASGMGFDF